MISAAFHLALLLVLPPLLPGVIQKTKAWLTGRTGPSVGQLYFDLAKLLRKDVVLSATTTWVFVAAPVVTLVGVAAAGLLLPLGPFASPVGFAGDAILFAYLLALGRFFTTAAALDTGSAFEGMGAAREVSFACLAEPAIFVAFLALARLAGSLRLAELVATPHGAAWPAQAAPVLLVVAGLFVVLLAETSRMPIDDPNTHLELTMIHEVMVLDHSGPLLGLVLYGAALKLFVLGALLVDLVAPAVGLGGGPLAGLLFVAEMLALAVVIGVVESVMARLRLRQVPALLIAAGMCCGFAFFLVLR